MRTEHDSMGAIQVPDDALWGAQTQRALENFTISGLRFGRRFIGAMAQVKRACALANKELGLLETSDARAIVRASDEIIEGRWDDQFPLDVFQTGSGTSTNMNVNEVIANRANQLLGGELGSKTPIHPNDHVNMSQSSNDVIPTAIHVASTVALRDELIPALCHLRQALDEKAVAFDAVVKPGRTHLQDATPIRLGQVFGGYAAQARKSAGRAERAREALRELPLGGTAVGTGLNRAAPFPRLAISHLNETLEMDFVEAENHVEANAARDAVVEASGELRTVAVSLTKVADDIRWLASGPRNGLGEIDLPAVQPGSSMMPGKVNPVMAEALILAAAQVIGHDAAITLGGLGGQFELNLMMPLLAYNLLRSIEWLARGAWAFADRCVVGISANRDRCSIMVERSLALATALVPTMGYDLAADIAQEAHRTGRTIREVVAERSELSPEEVDEVLDPLQMTQPGLLGVGHTKRGGIGAADDTRS